MESFLERMTALGLYDPMGMLKNHGWGEAYNVQFRCESFNLANRANFQQRGRALGSPDFGVISAPLPARVLQFGLDI